MAYWYLLRPGNCFGYHSSRSELKFYLIPVAQSTFNACAIDVHHAYSIIIVWEWIPTMLSPAMRYHEYRSSGGNEAGVSFPSVHPPQAQ